MKRILYILCAVIATALASCNNEEMTGDNGSDTRQVTLEAIADYAMADGSAVPQTRGTTTADRYVIEVYQQADYTEAANVFADGTNRATNSTGSFALTLEKDKSYYCLLWADKKANGVDVYTVTDLKNVSLVSGSNPTEAFHGTKAIDGSASTYSASLRRAVANIVLKETGTLAAGTLSMKFSQPTAFNVSTAATTGTPTDRTETITVAETTGTKEAPATISTDAIFVLAPATSTATMTFTFQYAAQDEFEVNDAKVQANYNTNITGHYDATVTPPASSFAVGDYYPAGATTQNAIGVVFYTTDGGTHGLIVSINEATGHNWTEANSWAEQSIGGLTWRLPTKDELQYLWCAFNGKEPVTWYEDTNDKAAADADAQDLFNEKLTDANGDPIAADYYWSATEAGNTDAWDVYFGDGGTGTVTKDMTDDRTRIISAF